MNIYNERNDNEDDAAAVVAANDDEREGTHTMEYVSVCVCVQRAYCKEIARFWKRRFYLTVAILVLKRWKLKEIWKQVLFSPECPPTLHKTGFNTHTLSRARMHVNVNVKAGK